MKVVKLEMAKVNINILGISELKWTGMGEFNSDEVGVEEGKIWSSFLAQVKHKEVGKEDFS